MTLADFEQHCCKALARSRHKNNRSQGVHNGKIGPQSDETTDLEGIGAEFALAKLLNVYPDMSIHTRSASKGTDADDLVLADGRTVDVKATKYKTGRLAVVPGKKASGDLFALMVGQFPTYRFKGAIEQSEVIQDSNLGDLGHGPTYLVEQKDLQELFIDISQAV